MNPVVCIASGNRGYLLSQYVYSPNQLDDLIPIGTPKILKVEEIEHIYKVILAIK